MKNRLPSLLGLFLFLFTSIVSNAQKPFGPTPTPRQLSWHQMDYYAFVHFNMNTFTGKEWGYGDESPALFNPSELDCRQWAKTAKEAGMKGIILTAKHHDGFCLWPSKYTEHSVKNSPWKNGKGDVVRELSEACKEYGLKMGVYLSPWDRNHPEYGQPEYITYFRNQLRELLTNYGEIFEVWFDGANGGDGYYGGARETRKVDRKTYYDWPTTVKLVRELQPGAVIFSDAGPDIRWVGNEAGFANPTNWCTINRDEFYPGSPNYRELTTGHKNGSHWVPAEVDVSIRPGWYYHPEEDTEVKSPDHLELIYYNSVGRNASLLLNLPVDKRGLVHEKDKAALKGLQERLSATFAQSILPRNMGQWEKITDGSIETFWAAPKGERTAEIVVIFPFPTDINVIELREYIPLGQRVEKFEIDSWQEGKWEMVAAGTTIGNRRLLNIPETKTNKLRVRIQDALAAPAIAEIATYYRAHENYLLEPEAEFNDRMSWWRNDGFGMFIHWGAYAVPAGIYKGKEVSGIGEWIMDHANIPIPEYEKFVRQFNPVQFDAEEWVRIAKDAGMKYIVITSKHHDGFCLWDSKVTKYDIINATPYPKDLLYQLSEACKKEGIKLCFYHSIMDWHHPEARGESFPNYRENYLKPQLRELVDNYDPHVLWFDGEWIEEWSEAQGKDLYQFVRKLKPEIIINNRVGKGRQGMQGMNKGKEFVGDFGTPEQEILEEGSEASDWESCMTMNDTWGYKKNDDNWKSTKTLIHNLVDIAAKGGNYLLNVGPTAEGLIPQPSVDRLKEMGDWMKVNEEVIYNTRMWKEDSDGSNIRYTWSEENNAVYAVALEWPGEELHIKYVQPKAGSKIYLLGYDQALEWNFDRTNGLSIDLPKNLQEEEKRPCQHAWAFKIQGSFPKVAEKATFNVGNKEDIHQMIFSEQTEISLHSGTPGATIHHTLDGSDPSLKSPVYSDPIKLTETTTLKAMVRAKGMIVSPVTQAQLNKSQYHGIDLAHPYSGRYNAGGPMGLVDGVKGSASFTDGNWQGFEGKDLEAVIDLGKIKPIRKINITFLENLGVWIFPPSEVSFAVSKDGKEYQQVHLEKIPIQQDNTGAILHQIEQPLKGMEGRYVKIIGKNIGTCPDWHAGSGGKAWIFADEIVIE